MDNLQVFGISTKNTSIPKKYSKPTKLSTKLSTNRPTIALYKLVLQKVLYFLQKPTNRLQNLQISFKTYKTFYKKLDSQTFSLSTVKFFIFDSQVCTFLMTVLKTYITLLRASLTQQKSLLCLSCLVKALVVRFVFFEFDSRKVSYT